MQVATRRRAEERRGGPAAPHNSLEASVIDLCDDTVIETEAETDVFDEVAEVGTQLNRGNSWSKEQAQSTYGSWGLTTSGQD